MSSWPRCGRDLLGDSHHADATPRLWKCGTTLTRRMARAEPVDRRRAGHLRVRRRRGRAARRARPITAATESTRLVSAVLGGSSCGRGRERRDGSRRARDTRRRRVASTTRRSLIGAVGTARSTSRRVPSSTSSWHSRSTMWPASGSSTSSALGSSSAIRWLCANGVIWSRPAADDDRRAPSSASSASYLSWPSKPGKKSATTSNGVAASISSVKSTYSCGTSVPNARRRVTTKPKSDPTRRPDSTSRGARARVATTAGDSRWMQPPGQAGQAAASTPRSSPALVEIRATPRIRGTEQLRVLLGERHDRHPAHRVTDQDDRVVGGRAGRARRRGRRPSWSIVQCSARDRPERPCERWS